MLTHPRNDRGLYIIVCRSHHTLIFDHTIVDQTCKENARTRIEMARVNLQMSLSHAVCSNFSIFKLLQ